MVNLILKGRDYLLKHNYPGTCEKLYLTKKIWCKQCFFGLLSEENPGNKYTVTEIPKVVGSLFNCKLIGSKVYEKLK